MRSFFKECAVSVLVITMAAPCFALPPLPRYGLDTLAAHSTDSVIASLDSPMPGVYMKTYYTYTATVEEPLYGTMHKADKVACVSLQGEDFDPPLWQGQKVIMFLNRKPTEQDIPYYMRGVSCVIPSSGVFWIDKDDVVNRFGDDHKTKSKHGICFDCYEDNWGKVGDETVDTLPLATFRQQLKTLRSKTEKK